MYFAKTRERTTENDIDITVTLVCCQNKSLSVLSVTVVSDVNFLHVSYGIGSYIIYVYLDVGYIFLVY